jgi:small subunit ribosomal protein S6
LKTAVKRLYEGLFLIDSALAAQDWDGINAAIEKILKRADAEIVSMKKWNEFKLAYEIKGQTRGTYVLTYFNADGQKIAGIERDVQLSDKVMRVLILKADHLTEEDINKDTTAILAEKKVQKAQQTKAKAKRLEEPAEEPKKAETEEIKEPEEQAAPEEAPPEQEEPKEAQAEEAKPAEETKSAEETKPVEEEEKS